MQGMSILFDPINVILASIVLFVVLKLFHVLGQRTGNEKLPPLPTFKTEPLPTDVTVSPNLQPRKPVWEGYAEEGSALALGLTAIAKQDPNFDPKSFVIGAKIAHERVLEAFAQSDLATLKFLLANKVYAVFEAEVNRRKQQGELAVFKFVGINSAIIKAAKVQGNQATIDIEFSSQMISALKSKANVLLQGSETALDDVKELWSFARDLTSRDPNWKLVETHDHD